MPQIPNALIPCYVIQMNNTLFRQGDKIVGKILDIPCKNDFIDDPEWWAVPIKDAGIFTTIEFIPFAEGDDQFHPPTYDSFAVMRVRDKLSGYTWWVYGTRDNFVNSCSTCCGSAPIPMPGTITDPAIVIAPCDQLCIRNALGQYFSVTALPTLVGSEVYFPYGSHNNLAFPAASGSGYSTPSLLLAFLNANWTNVGSPNVTFVWSLSPDNMTLIATGGNLGDTVCVVISTVGTSA